ncbi:MAG: hypothetical protein N2043_06245 [Ignavibacterium sp.]|nr:hypothetical protein [Ignavibacterium sp.]
MNLTVKTTYREFEEFFLRAIEQTSLNDFKDKLQELVKSYPNHYNAWLFLAKTLELLGDIEKAATSYLKVIQLLDPTKMGFRIIQLKKDILTFCKKYKMTNLEEQVNLVFNNIKGFEEAFLKTSTIRKASSNINKIIQDDFNKTKVYSLLREANKLFSKSKFEEALKKAQEAEKLIKEPNAQVYITIANIALGLKNWEKANKIVIDAVSKGFPIANQNEKFALGNAIAAIYRRLENWTELEKITSLLYQNATTLQRKIISLLGLIEANLKLGKGESAKELIEELLRIDPYNKTAISFQKRLSFSEDGKIITIQEFEEFGEEFAAEVAQQQKFALSPMLRRDLEDHKYTDADIIRKGFKPDFEDFMRLLTIADKKIEEALERKQVIFIYYPIYLEASKAFSDLPSNQKQEDLFQKCLGRYSSLKATELYVKFKEAVLENNKSIDIDYLQKLHDSSKSYYLESLRLTLDSDKRIAEMIVNNYIKISAILIRIKNGDIIRSESFQESFRVTSKNCLQNKILTRSFCEGLLNLGAVNSQNFNRIFGAQWLKNLFKLEVNKYKGMILDEMSDILSLKLSLDIPVSRKLKRFFEERRNQYDKLHIKINQVLINDFHPQFLNDLLTDWNELSNYLEIITETDRSIYKSLCEIINKFKSYLELRENEKSALIQFLIDELKEIIRKIRQMPTFWGRIGFEPIINNWQESLNRLMMRRFESLQPKLIIDADPKCISLINQNASINILVKNIGAAAIEKINYNFSFKNFGNIIFEKKIEKESIIQSGDYDGFVVNISEEEFSNLDDPFEIEVTAFTNFRDIALSFTQNITITKKIFKDFSIEEIPWNETRQVIKDLFKGRDDLIQKLVQHYLSENRIETYILYGLTRHGKSSIHRFLAENLKLKVIKTEKGEKRYLPFNWSFAKAASCGNARDMWNYLIRECILDKLEEYINHKEIPISLLQIPELNRFLNRQVDFRSTHFSKILKILNEEGYLAFIAIDEFTFYTEMIDKGMVNPSFLQQIREITIDEKTACFIFAGIYDLVEILKEPKYGITSQLANCLQYQVGPIDSKSSEELILVFRNKLDFTKEAIKYIQFASNNIPHFIQMICRRCGWYAQATKRNVIGLPEVDLVISTMVGENKIELPGGVKPLEGQFRDTQYRPQELFNNAVISTIALKSKGMKTPRGVSREEMIQTWGAHRAEKGKSTPLGNFQGRLSNAIETLTQRGVLVIEDNEDIPLYRIGVDLFRRWWCVQYPSLESELDKLIGVT